MGQWPLRHSTAGQEIPLGPFVDSTDGDTAETALTIANTDIKLQKNGATAEVNKNSGGATHLAGGRYYAVIDATDSDTLGPMRVSCHMAGALHVWLDCDVLIANVYDSRYSTDKLQVHAVEISNDLITAASIAADVTTEIQSGLATAAALDVVDTEVAAIKAKTDQLTFTTANEVDSAAMRLATQAKADVNAEVVDAVNVDTYGEPGQAIPPATTTLAEKLAYVYKAWRNKKEQDGSESRLFADNGTTVDQQAAVSDDSITTIVGKMGAGT